MKIIRLLNGNVAVIGQWALPEEVQELKQNWPRAITSDSHITVSKYGTFLRGTADFLETELLIAKLVRREVSSNFSLGEPFKVGGILKELDKKSL
jgi:hypothetical protein